ncbi:MAG TPA: trypsin-like peptidase domain-containing protein [Phycisphaerae bacterium]|nr:trypsin-like peptidase domain-containing protein [Phycisphaerae bacterium]
MSISVIVLVMAAHVLAQTTPALAQADGRDAWGDLLRQAAAKVAPTVVTIETVGGTQSVAKGSAASMPLAKAGFILADGPTTGLVWSADGLILTSQFNFLRDPSVVTVVLADGRRLVGELLARDEVCGLAMLKVDAANLPVPEWRPDDEPIRVGQTVMALGRGFGGPECSLNVGIVSGLNRMSGLAIQTDARLSPGNFGGPLIDIQGRVLGICVSMSLSDEPIAGVEWYDSGIGFAVPRPLLRVSVESLAVGHSLRRGLFGVRLDSRPNMPLHVRQVADPSPAMRGGMQAGDRILAVGGRPVKSYLDLKRAIRARRAGEWVDVRVRRDGHDVDLRLMLAVSEDIGPLSGEPESQPGFAESVPP